MGPDNDSTRAKPQFTVIPNDLSTMRPIQDLVEVIPTVVENMQADKKFLAYKNVQEDDWKYPERLEKRDRIPVSDSHGDLFGTLSTLLTITTTFGSAFGPWGVAISLTAAIMNPIVSSFRPKVDMFAEALATVKRLERRALMDKLAGKLIAFGVWCVNQDGLFWSTDILMAEYQQDILLQNLRDELGPASQDNLFGIVENRDLESQLKWDSDPSERVLVLLSVTYLIVAYNLQCWIWASMALSAAATKDGIKYKEHAASYRLTLSAMEAALDRHVKSLKKKLDEISKWRIAQLQKPIQKKLPPGPLSNSIYWLDWKDDYNYGGTRSTVSVSVVPTQSPGWKVWVDYRDELLAHVERTLHNDYAIIDMWEKIRVEAKKYLGPPKLTEAPIISGYKPSSVPDPLLVGADEVAYSYSLKNSEGESGTSPWSSFTLLKQGSLPKVQVDDHGLRVTMTIYRRVKKGSTVTETVAPPIQSEGKGVFFFVDEKN